jgi:hypothetical protein
MKRRLFHTIIVVMVFILPQCKDKLEDCTQYDYDRCNTERPVNASVKVNLTINQENPYTVLHWYEGFWEENRLKRIDTISNKFRWYVFDVEKYYTVTATYKKGNNTIIAVDGGSVKVNSYQACEYTCYEAKELELNLQID